MTVSICVGFVSFCVPKSPPVFFTVVGLYLWIFFHPCVLVNRPSACFTGLPSRLVGSGSNNLGYHILPPGVLIVAGYVVTHTPANNWLVQVKD